MLKCWFMKRKLPFFHYSNQLFIWKKKRSNRNVIPKSNFSLSIIIFLRLFWDIIKFIEWHSIWCSICLYSWFWLYFIEYIFLIVFSLKSLPVRSLITTAYNQRIVLLLCFRLITFNHLPIGVNKKKKFNYIFHLWTSNCCIPNQMLHPITVYWFLSFFFKR